MTRARLLLLPLLLLLASGTALAAAPPSADARFEAMLRAIDRVPDRGSMDRAFPDARERLLRAARDGARDRWTRLRALSLLSAYPTAGVREALEGLGGDPLSRVRALALYAVGRAFGRPGDARLVAHLRKGLSDRDPEVRRYALRALRWIDHPAAGVALRAVAERHPEAAVRRLAAYVERRRAARMKRDRRAR